MTQQFFFRTELIFRFLSFFQLILVFKCLSPEEIGRVAPIIAYLTISQMICEGSFGGYQVANKIKGISIGIICFIVSISVISLLFGIYSLQIISLSFFDLKTKLVICILVIVMPLASYFTSAAINTSLFLYNKMRIVSNIVSFAMFAIAVYCDFGGISYIFALIFSNLSVLTMTCNSLVNNDIKICKIKIANKPAIKFITLAILITFISFSFQYLDILIGKNYLKVTDIGNLSLSINLSITVTSIFLSSITPIYTYQFSLSTKSSLKRLFRNYFKIYMKISCMIILYAASVTTILLNTTIFANIWNSLLGIIVFTVAIRCFYCCLCLIGDYFRFKLRIIIEFLILLGYLLIMLISYKLSEDMTSIIKIRLILLSAGLLIIMQLLITQRKEIGYLLLSLLACILFLVINTSIYLGIIVLVATIYIDFQLTLRVSLIKRVIQSFRLRP